MQDQEIGELYAYSQELNDSEIMNISPHAGPQTNAMRNSLQSGHHNQYIKHPKRRSTKWAESSSICTPIHFRVRNTLLYLHKSNEIQKSA